MGRCAILDLAACCSAAAQEKTPTQGMQTTSDGRDDGGYDDPTASSSNKNTRRRRDHTHWAVDLQPFSLCPAGCRSCGHYFLLDEPRMCTWSERPRPRWLHPACLLPEQTAVIEALTPIGTATDQHVTQIKDSWRTPTPALANLLQQEDKDSSKLDWHELGLPNREWWGELDLQPAIPTTLHNICADSIQMAKCIQ